MNKEIQLEVNFNNIKNIKIPTSMLDSVYVENFWYYKRLIDTHTTNRKTMLQIGADKGNHSQSKEFWGVDKYINLDIQNDNSEYTVVGDITDCKNLFDDETFDLVFTSDTFEHLKEPWKAAKEIVRVLNPGGIVFISTAFSWRYHPVPIDYWRFSPQCLSFLFEELDCIETNWDNLNRRQPIQGSTREDTCPTDHINKAVKLEGWIENWRVYYLGRKKL